MLRRPLILTLALLASIPVTGLLQGCSSSGKAAGIRQVDDLISRIERVHLESELSRERIKSVMDSLRGVVTMDQEADVVETFAAFTAAIAASEQQSNKLRSAIGPMKSSADAVFARWTQDLGDFSSAEMRRRSTERMDETRARYDAIVASVGPAVTNFEIFNSGLRDLSLFLGHDLNTQAVQSVGGEVQVLADDAITLNTKLVATLEACREYVRAAAPTGTAVVDRTAKQTEAGEAKPK